MDYSACLSRITRKLTLWRPTSDRFPSVKQVVLARNRDVYHDFNVILCSSEYGRHILRGSEVSSLRQTIHSQPGVVRRFVKLLAQSDTCPTIAREANCPYPVLARNPDGDLTNRPLCVDVLMRIQMRRMNSAIQTRLNLCRELRFDGAPFLLCQVEQSPPRTEHPKLIAEQWQAFNMALTEAFPPSG